jgi:hypothetical protein
MPIDSMPRELTDAQLNAMKARVQANPRLAAMFSSANPFLQASEYEVIQMMAHSGAWTGTVPSNPNPGVSGSVEFGLFDYWLNSWANNPNSSWEEKLILGLWKWLAGGLPKTLISSTNYQNLLNAVQPSQPGLVAADGTWFSENTYGGADPAWVFAFLYYLYTYSGYEGSTSFAPFAQSPRTVPISGALSSQVTIALVGDWGTGNYALGTSPSGPAASVIQAIVGLNPKPDYIIHLGDVYYYGSTSEEASNLVGMWPTAYAGKSFTLNSNHEMYYGAYGYYSALANPSNIFSLQNGTSYFALQYGNATIIGLDSAYWSNSPLVMNGSIQDPSSTASGNTAQTTFLNGLVQNGLAPQNTIVLTHHNPITTDGSAYVTDSLGNNLWAQVTGPKALNGTPKAWYWGHVHNGIVYPNPNNMGDKVYGRCVGHGALPFGNAWGLEPTANPKPDVQCYANTPNPNTNPYPLMMNGFVLLTITQKGQVTETFYQQDGTQAPWVKPYTYQLGT